MATDYQKAIDELLKAGVKQAHPTVRDNELSNAKLALANLKEHIAAREEKLKSIDACEQLGHLQTLRDEARRVTELEKRIETLSPKQAAPKPEPTT